MAASTAGDAAFSARIRPASTVSSRRRSPKTPRMASRVPHCQRAGRCVEMEARNLILYDAEGRPVRVVGVNVDVTERKRALVQLRAFTETLEEAVKERTRELEAQNEARQKAE